MPFLQGYVIIDWAARDREMLRQLRLGILDIDKINAAATIKRVEV